MGWDPLLSVEKDSPQKDIQTILSRIYSHMNEILALVKEDRASLNEIAERLSSLEKRIAALENRKEKGK
jgi:peptidoglycan hydrolase CwlO-like protein